jgi:hypothetical protein
MRTGRRKIHAAQSSVGQVGHVALLSALHAIDNGALHALKK